MIEGVFVEQPKDVHVCLRSELLERGPRHLPDTSARTEAPAAGAVGAVTARLDELRARGLIVVELDEPLSDSALVEVGWLLGDPRRHPPIPGKQYTDDELILNLISESGHTEGPSQQVFSTTYLTLHTEGSTRPLEWQPRFIALMCCDAGDDASEAATVLVPMAAVGDQLDATTLDVLMQTRYRTNDPAAPIARRVGARCVFSFKDFLDQPLEWVHTGRAADAAHVNQCIRALLRAMLAPATATSIRWQRGVLAVFDNTFFFHGRTAGGAARPTRPRHMKHMQMIAP
jgi:hypothetical protein